ncbi:MAG: hypothetical protein ACHQZQ_02115 [SAR324 cluster bacterium]
MIRYEIYSNVASSDQGLQAYPALQQLAESLRAKDVDARFIRIVQREEGEINLASSQYARGVTVRGMSVKAIPPEASLKGLTTWLKTVTSRVDRGLHLELEHVRQTNGAGIVIAQALAAGQRAFISGLDEVGWARLTTSPDLTGQKVPDGLLENPRAQGEYLVRRTRPAGFWAMLNAVVQLDLLAPPAQQRCLALSKSHDPKELADLPDPLVVAIGLLSDGLERQQKLVEQFADSVSAADTSGELPMLFELITHGIPFAALLQALLPFTLEVKRRGIVNRRVLANEVRIGLANGQGTQHHLRAALLPLVVQARAANDPDAYRAATRLFPQDPDTLAALAVPRNLYLDLAAAVAETGPAPGALAEDQAQAPVPVSLKQRVMELIVTLIHRAQYAQTFRDGVVPAAVQAVRDLLGALLFDVFNIAEFRGLKSNVPARGVARNLAERVPLAWGEMLNNMEILEGGLYPYAAVSRSLAERIAGKFKDAGEQERVDGLNQYLRGSVHLLRLTTYMMGRAGLNAMARQALLEAGRSLGLTVYESRDELRRDADPESEVEGQVAIQGTVMLLQRDDSRMFPLRARPGLILQAYRYLVRTQMAQATRSYLLHKLNYLVNRYGSELFEVLYQRLTWESMVSLSRRQLWEILAESRVLDAERLKELGYRADQDAQAAEGENPWLARARVDEPAGTGTPSSASLEQGYRDAYNGFNEFVQRFPPSKRAPGESGPVTLRAALGVLFGKEEVYTPAHAVARPILAGTLEAEALGQALVVFLGANEALLAGQEPEEAFELAMPGRLAALTLLKDRFTLTVGPVSRLLRLVPAPGKPDSGPQLGELDGAARLVAGFFAPLVGGGPSSVPAAEMHLKLLAQALPVLSAFRTLWAKLLQASTAMFIDQALQETILKFIRPGPPAAKDLVKVPEEQVLCLAPSTFNQAKFHRVVTRVDRKDAFLTLSEMAGWLARLQRLREEQRFYRDLIGDIQGIIRSLNLSVFDAAYIVNYGRALNRLDEALNVRPEAIGPGDLKRIQERARDISMMLRDMYGQESGLRMRDRWLNRIIIELKRQRSNARINFVDAMWEAGAVPPKSARDSFPGSAKDADGAGNRAERTEKTEKDAGRDARAPEFQTFSERLRQCIEFRQRMNRKQVIVLSPANTQKALTLNVIDQLYRLKGLNLTVLVDTSSADSFAAELLSRVPPHRLFDLNAL